jgi:MoxR-like ATPase
MEERQVTVAGKTYKMPDLFMVLATENPIEQEGTYPLPEAQLDRFLMHVVITYPDEATEGEIIKLNRAENAQKPVTHAAEPPPGTPASRFRGARRSTVSSCPNWRSNTWLT